MKKTKVTKGIKKEYSLRRKKCKIKDVKRGSM